MTSTTSVQEKFERDGFVGPLDILTRSEAKRALDDVMKELAKPNANRFKLHLVLPSLSNIVHHPALISAVQQALDTKDVLLWSTDVNVKPPKSPGYFAPHQDSTYAGLVPPSKCLTAWVALSDPVGALEGCLSFYPKSHQVGQLPHETRTKDDSSNTNGDNNNMLSLGQSISSDQLGRLKELPLQVALLGGQTTLHSFYSVHFSGPNETNHPRVGFALRYMASSVHQSKPIKEMVTWISGDTTCDHFDLEPKLPLNPSLEEVQAGYEIRDKAMRREEANYFADDSYATGHKNVTIQVEQ